MDNYILSAFFEGVNIFLEKFCLIMFSNPTFYILLVNIVTLIWAIRSLKKNIREKWMNNLRDSSSELIGAAESIYIQKYLYGTGPLTRTPELMAALSEFIAKKQKILLLFEDGSDTFKRINDAAEKLRTAANECNDYANEKENFRKIIGDRLHKEWVIVNGW